MSVQTITAVEPSEKQRRYTPQQKFKICREAEEAKDFGLIAKKYNIHLSTIYDWRVAIANDSEKFLNKPAVVRTEREITRLRRELEELKEVIVSQSQEIFLLKKEQR
jgi:transposase-like protein